ncbi:hypothetical protein FQA39_LY03180 [Lamprigera yunnana]|nr:hypothetical protein FQA39_LY03180 [Lamprigera yunnana]
MHFKRNIVILEPYSVSKDDLLPSDSDETTVESALLTSAFTSASSSQGLEKINAIEDKDSSTAEERQQRRRKLNRATWKRYKRKFQRKSDSKLSKILESDLIAMKKTLVVISFSDPKKDTCTQFLAHISSMKLSKNEDSLKKLTMAKELHL